MIIDGIYNFNMKKLALFTLVLISLLMASCAAPVIKKDLLAEGIRNVSLSSLAANQNMYRGKLFILGGIIAATRVTDEGTVIEALYVPVDEKGYLEETPGRGRYLAIWPKESGILDPMVYRRNRQITVAGTFEGFREGKLDKTTYSFPVFDAVQIFLWKEVPPYPSYYYSPYYYGPYYPYYYPYPYYSPYFGFGFSFEGEQEEHEEHEFHGRGGFERR